MTIVADQSYTNARHTQVLGNFHNNGDFSGFSGLVIYTRLSGMIVRADRYLDGERVCCANLQKIQSMTDFNGRIRALLKVFGVIRVNRTFSYLDTRCAYGCSPDDSCAHPEDNGYWDNDSTPIPLDSAGYCVADTTDLADPDGVSVQEPLGVMIGFPMAIGMIMSRIRLQAEVEGQMSVRVAEIIMHIIWLLMARILL